MGARTSPVDSDRRRALDMALYVAVPIGVAVVIALVLAGERTTVTRDLQLRAPHEATAGETLAMRAFLIEGLDMGGAPEVRSVPVAVALVDPAGNVVRETTLSPSALLGMDGALELGVVPAGRYTVRARALGEASDAVVDSPLAVGSTSRPLTARSRLLAPLQHYSALTSEAGPGTLALDLRVPGGLCVPETPCEVLVWVGGDGAAIALERSGAVEPLDLSPSEMTAGVVTRRLAVHGPEASVDVVATRDGAEVGRRRWQLPIVANGLVVSLPSALVDEGTEVELLVRAEVDRAVHVDLFRDGRWTRARTMPLRAPRVDPRAPGDGEMDDASAIGLGPLEAGRYRVQVRTEALTGDAQSSRVFVVRPRGEAGEAVVEAASRAHVARYANDPFVATGAHRAAPAATALSFLFAYDELEVVDLPDAMSGYLQAVTGSSGKRTWTRWAGAIVILLFGVFVVLMVARRGLAASIEAGRVVTEAEHDPDVGARQRRMALLTTGALTAAVVVLFVAIAAMVLARGGC